MDEKSKQIFVQTEIMGISYKDISQKTGEKIGTLLSRKSRAAKKIQKYLNDYVYKEAE